MDLTGLQECGSQHLAHSEPQQTLVVTGIALGGPGRDTLSPSTLRYLSHALLLVQTLALPRMGPS